MNLLGPLSKMFRSSSERNAAITNSGEVAAPADFDFEGPNAHLADYINYYRGLKKPGFAVLVTGEWGTGKTHLIRQLLPWEGEDKQSNYVSFFGLKSAAEVDAAIYAEMYPRRSALQERVKGVGEATRGVSVHGYSAGGIIDGGANLISAYMRKEIDTSKPIIFDDLERSSMETDKEKLGVINYYVEHKHCRVIVIAHDEKLVGEIVDAKEKIFGQTIRIEPDANAAFKQFKTQLADNETALVIARLERVILDVFINSETKSLRILRHVMLDLQRLFETFEKRHIENERAIQDLVPLFVALAIGTRTNSLDAESLKNRQGARLKRELQIIESSRGGKEVNPSKFETARKNYTNVDLENQVLNDDVLIDMLVCGRFDKDAIYASLDNSTYFAKAGELPPWRKVIAFDNLPDNVVEEAKSAMEQQFSTRSVTEVGEMLHIFALRMMMAKHGMLANTVEEVAEESKSYVDDLLTEGRLPAPNEDEFDDSIRMSGSHGIGFWTEDSYQDLFAGVVTHLRAQRNVALERTYPALANQLLEMLATEPRGFAGAISYLPGGTQKFAGLPIMKVIPVEKFVGAWRNAPNGESEAWHWTRRGFEQRYQNPAFLLPSGPLASEAEWVRAVLEKMRGCAEAETGFRRFRIQRFIPRVQVPHA
jgi:hypothetical protein